MLTWLPGCGMFQAEDPAPSPVAEAPARLDGRAGKHGKRGKHGKHKRPVMTGDPVGAEGPVAGSLAFEDKPAEGDNPAMTAVTLDLTWGEDGSHQVDLGAYPGPCAEVEPTPVGQPGRERTPMWAIRCGPPEAETPSEVFLMQVGASLSVIQRVEPSKQFPDRPRFRPVAKLPLVAGAELEKGS